VSWVTCGTPDLKQRPALRGTSPIAGGHQEHPTDDGGALLASGSHGAVADAFRKYFIRR